MGSEMCIRDRLVFVLDPYDLYLCDFLGVVSSRLEDFDLLVDIGGVHPLGAARPLRRVLRVVGQQGTERTGKKNKEQRKI